MGYPMTYPRVIGRNKLQGDYGSTDGLGLIRGDLRRLEKDALDDNYGAHIARAADVEPDVARRVLVAFFSDANRFGWIPPGWEPPNADA